MFFEKRIHKLLGKINKRKRDREKRSLNHAFVKSNGSCNLTGAKATGASIDSLGSSVYNCLNSSDVGLPCSV